MKLTKPIVPKELDADVAMAVIIQHMDLTADQKPDYSYEFKGVSERTALGDNLDVTVRNRQNTAPSVKFSLKRDSLYHILPEFLFHPWTITWVQMGILRSLTNDIKTRKSKKTRHWPISSLSTGIFNG